MIRGGDLFTAAQAGRICRVDLKTIHNWAARGKLPHHRTEGRHIRIHRVDLVAFLRRYEMPVPRELAVGTPRVALVDGDADALARLGRALEPRFDVTLHPDAVDALLAFGLAPPECLVVSAPLAGIDVAHLIGRLRAVDRTAHVRVVVIGGEEVAGAETIPRDKQTATLAKRALEALTGLA